MKRVANETPIYRPRPAPSSKGRNIWSVRRGEARAPGVTGTQLMSLLTSFDISSDQMHGHMKYRYCLIDDTLETILKI